MTRCSQKTAKGLRCKSHGIEMNGKIICATHLKQMVPELIPVAEPIAAPTPTPICTHKNKCTTSTESCCECTDVRPIEEHGYKSYNKRFSDEFTIVSRHHYYCFGCKKRLNQDEFDATIAEMIKIVEDAISAHWYINQLARFHKILVDVHSSLEISEENWRFHVNDTLDHILSSRLAGMPEDVATWSTNDLQIYTLMNKLTTIHKSMLTKPQPPTQPKPQPPKPVDPDRPETLEKAYERIDELQKMIVVAKSIAKDAAKACLWNSGCEDLCYHFGNCSDIMVDCWMPVYNEYGLERLKKHLYNVSNEYHDGKTCEDCDKWIDWLHD